jgi:Tfp pilus assembly protein PilE
MNRKSFTLVEIMIVLAIIILLAAIAIPNLFNPNKASNIAAAKANVTALSKAVEAYATAHNGSSYPADVTELGKYMTTAATLCGNTVQGYAYDCTGLLVTGYTLIATPVPNGKDDITFTAKTGGVITEAVTP